MKGISSSVKSRIYDIVDGLFDRMSLRLLGQIPSLKGKKTISFTAQPDHTLGSLFIKSLGTNTPMPNETEAMKSILSTAEEYVSALRSKTKADLAHKVEAYIMESRSKGIAPSTVNIKKEVETSLEKARKHFQMIGDTEATKSRNMGRALQIGKVGASMGVDDPNCFFVVLRDGSTCPECIRVHLLPDRVTPRVFKLSEVKFGYHKKGENTPSISGLHPRCRCVLVYLAPGFGLVNGQVTYISPEHDEYKKQRGQQ